MFPLLCEVRGGGEDVVAGSAVQWLDFNSMQRGVEVLRVGAGILHVCMRMLDTSLCLANVWIVDGCMAAYT